MKRERSDVAYRKKLRRAKSIALSLQMAFEGFRFEDFRQPYWTFSRQDGGG